MVYCVFFLFVFIFYVNYYCNFKKTRLSSDLIPNDGEGVSKEFELFQVVTHELHLIDSCILMLV